MHFQGPYRGVAQRTFIFRNKHSKILTIGGELLPLETLRLNGLDKVTYLRLSQGRNSRILFVRFLLMCKAVDILSIPVKECPDYVRRSLRNLMKRDRENP